MISTTLTKSILILASNPQGTARLRLDQEVQEIKARLQRSKNRELFSLHQELAVSTDDLRFALVNVNPQIVHFCGHGAGEEGLAFEDKNGHVQLVDAIALAELFALCSEHVECVLLNACYSEVQADAISQHINYVIGMSQAIQDRAALKFAIGFYDALGAGRPVEVAYKFGCNAIQLEGIPQHLVPVLKKKPAGDVKTVLFPVISQPPAASAQKPIEVFFSYSHKDEALRDQLANHLSNLQRQKVIQQWHDRQIMPGTEWDGEINLHLKTSDVILLLISSDFISSNYCWDIEVKHAMLRHEAGDACVVPVILRPVDWRDTPFSKLQALPTNAKPITSWSDKDEAFLNIVEGLRSVVKELIRKRASTNTTQTGTDSVRTFSSLPDNSPARYENLPRSGVMKFIGRIQELVDLHQQLHQNNHAGIVAITGMGGVGKTELALQYARQYLTHYSGGICWIPARTAQVGPQILDFARLYFNLTPPDNLTLLQQIAFCWQNWAPGEVLLILDDVPDYEQIEPFLPPVNSRFKVLMTIRRQLGAAIPQRSLDVLQPDAALELFGCFIGADRIQREQAEASKLCEMLGYLPLGLELVGRYLTRKPDLTLTRMQQRLSEKGLRDRAVRSTETGMTARLGMEAAFDLSWEMLPDEATQLGCLLSLFAPAPIPWMLVERCLPQQDMDDLEDIRDDHLMNLHLLQRKQEGVYQLNQLVRRFIREQDDCLENSAELSKHFCQAMVSVAAQIPEDPTRDLVIALRPVIPHLAEAATTLNTAIKDADLIKPFEGLGRFYRGQGLYSEAERWFEQCRETLEQRFGATHPAVATSINHLASIYRVQGRYSEAESLYRQSLEIRQQLLGKEHSDVADSLNNLALLYYIQGRYGEAEPLYRQSLEMRQRLLGEHSDVADSLNNLGLLYEALGRYTEAERSLVQALELRKHLVGDVHLRVAGDLNNLAYLYVSQERFSEAEPLYIQALNLYRQLLGDEHPDVANGLNNLAELYDLQERYEEAKPLLEQALAINQRILGLQHPSVAICLNNLAGVYDLLGRQAEAEALYLRALDLRQTFFGANHPKVGISLNNLAKLYFLQERYREAKPLYERAIVILGQQLGVDHPTTVKVRSNLKDLQRATRTTKKPKTSKGQ